VKLSRVQVTDFRKLTRVVIEDLAPGLNVVVGDNEAGKSTLLAAMRAALFERHRVTGQIVDEMLPYGRQVRPTVEIDFSMGGADYRLLKAFASRPEARLIGAGGTEWTGDEADETLSRILRFTRPGRGESKPDQHHGAFGMLWVSQGTAHHTPSIGAVREQVAGAIEREVGAVAGGEHGRSMLQRAADRQALFWDKLRRPRGDYRKAVEELAGSRAQRDAVRGRLRELEADVATAHRPSLQGTGIRRRRHSRWWLGQAIRWRGPRRATPAVLCRHDPGTAQPCHHVGRLAPVRAAGR